jgi:hypothetical protein
LITSKVSKAEETKLTRNENIIILYTQSLGQARAPPGRNKTSLIVAVP